MLLHAFHRFQDSRCHALQVSETVRQPGNRSAGGAEDTAHVASRYDPRRARARLALIEQQITLAEALTDLEQAAARPALPPGTPDPWEQSRTRAERAAADARHWISQLAPLVAEPETVADEEGRLPRDRREASLGEFAAKVNAEIAGLNEKLPAVGGGLKTTRGKQQRAAARDELRQGTARRPTSTRSPRSPPPTCAPSAPGLWPGTAPASRSAWKPAPF
jgi:hypothetical protein